MTLQSIRDNLLAPGNKGFFIPGITSIYANRNLLYPTDAQGQYYAEAIEIRDHREKSATFSPTVPKQGKIRKKKLTKENIKLALSIVGIIEDGLEPDLSENFREYFYKND
jgi:hypothetical protein